FDCDPVPCPECGRYQSHMYSAIRRSYLFWMWRCGLWFMFFFAGFLFITWIVTSNKRLPPDRQTVITFWAITIALGFLGTLLIATRKMLAWRLDPNGGDPELRKELGRKRAIRKADVDKHLAQTLGASGSADPNSL